MNGKDVARAILVIALGVFSGFLIYFETYMLLVDAGDENNKPSRFLLFLAFVGGWAGASYLMWRSARTFSKVFSRAFLIWAGEWLAMIPIGILFSGKMAAATMSKAAISTAPTAAKAGAAIGASVGAGFVSFVTGGFAIFMALASLMGFAISFFLGREMKPEPAADSKKCPQCAELIKTDAVKCRFCGYEFGPPVSRKSGLIRCPHCHRNVPAGATRCPLCRKTI